MSFWQQESMAAVLLVASLVAMGLAGFAFSGSRRETARPFALFQLGIFAWCFFDYLTLISDRPSQQFFYYRLSWLGIFIVPPAALAFAKTIGGKALRKGEVISLAVVPCVLVLASALHGDWRLWTTESPERHLLLINLGPTFWIATAYSYLVVAICLFIFARRLGSFRGAARRWLRHTYAIIFLPILANLYHIYALLASASPGYPFGVMIFRYDALPYPFNPTPIAFAVEGLFMILALRSYNILDTVPFAKDLVLDAIKDPVATLDRDGHLIGLNREGQALLSASRPAEGSRLSELCPVVGDPPADGVVVWRLDGKVYEVVTRRVRRRFLSWSGYLVIFRDVTEAQAGQEALERREEALRRYAFMVNASREGMCIVDSELRYAAANEAFCQSRNLLMRDIIGRRVEEVWQASPYAPRVVAGFESCFKGRASVLRFRHAMPGGPGERDFELSFNPYKLPDGTVSHAVLVAKDVTDYLEAQRELLAARERADAANEAKGNYLAGMSHEIRTPLNAIIGLTELSLRSGLPEEQRDNLETVLGAAHGLLDLINDILDLSKIEAGRMTLEKVDFDLHSQVSSILKTLRFAAEDKGLTLDLVIESGTPRALVGDVVKLGQVVTNLVGNAIKFTEKGGVTVTLSPLPIESRAASLPGSSLRGPDAHVLGIRVSVRDTGIGIPAEKQKVIFESYSQADSSVSRRYGGTGLGLAICRNLARLFGGDIELSSAAGEGSTFTLTAFFERGEPQEAARRADTACDDKQRGLVSPLDILVIEDNPVNAKVAMRWLALEGHRPKAAASAGEAFDLLASTRFDVVLTDIELPDLDGFEVARRIRSGLSCGPSGSSVPIFAMTAHAGAETREACRTAGMDGHVVKPVDFRELTATLARAVPPPPEPSPEPGQDRALPSSIDPEPPLRRLGGDEELYKEILGIFAAEAGTRTAAMEAAIAAGQAERLRRLAHGLRGSAKTVGAEALAGLAAALEEDLQGAAPGLPEDTEAPLRERTVDLARELVEALKATADTAWSMLPPGYTPPVEE